MVSIKLTVLALLLCCSSAATLHDERPSYAMRRERRIVTLDARGEVAEEKSEPSAESKTDAGMDQMPWFCNTDFPLGTENSNNCTHGTQLLDERLCKIAAHLSGASSSHHTFNVLQAENFDHPHGCFKNYCNADSNSTVCYYYNDKGGDRWPLPINGTPVCQRPKYTNGTNNGQGGCPDSYEVIYNETLCNASAICLGYAVGPMSDLLDEHNTSQHLDYPEGCFIGDRKVHYNKPASGNLERGVRGTPMCIHYPNYHFGNKLSSIA